MTLANKVAQFNADVDKVSQFTHGDDATVVQTENGPVRSLAKLVKDNDAAINATGLLNDVNSVKYAADVSAAAAATAQSKAEAARDAALLTGNVFQTVEEGIAATTNGKYFSVPSSSSADSLILYKNNAGANEEIKRYPAVAKVDEIGERVTSFPSNNEYVPLIADAAGNVAVYLENGNLGVNGFTPEVFTLMRDAVGMERQVSSDDYLPLIADEAGNVPVWMEKGLLGAKGLSPGLMAQINAGITLPEPARPVSTDGRALYRWRAKLAAVAAGTGVAKVLLTGDSWAEQTPIGTSMLANLRQEYPITATGWRESNAAYPDFDGSRFVFLGTTWTRYDASDGVAPVSGCGLDGHARTATGTAGTFEFRDVIGTGITIYYTDTDGSFEYEIDGSGTWVPVVGTNTGALSKVTISDLAQGVHTLKGRTTNNTGTVQINGARAFSVTPGIELVKAGNGGLRGAHFPLFTSQIPYHAADIQPDVVVVVIGTNDYRAAGATVADYLAGLSALVAAYRSAVSDVGFVFVSPADTAGPAVVPLAEYVQATYEFALENGHEFYSAFDDFGSYAQMNALGMFADTAHLNDAGATFLASRLVHKQLFF